MLKRRPDDWRNMQADRKRIHDQSIRSDAAESTTPKVADSSPQYPGKRKRHADDEIEVLFNASFGKKVKKTALGPELKSVLVALKPGEGVDTREALGSHRDHGLERVLGAIRTAPKDEKLHGKRKHHQKS